MKKKDKNTTVVNKELLFYKDGRCWYADVEGHTQSQNLMVAGADKIIEGFSCGKPGVMVRVSADCEKPKPYKVRLRRIEHDPFGATYLAFIKGKTLPRPAWLCNVTHTVFGGEHPKRIYIHEIATVDDPKPKTKGAGLAKQDCDIMASVLTNRQKAKENNHGDQKIRTHRQGD